MATYPSFGQLVGSTEEWVDDLQIDRAVSGGVKARAFYSVKKRRFRLKHYLSTTDIGTLQTFYDTYRLAANSFVWAADGQTYTVLFDGAPRVTPTGTTYFNVEVALVEQ